MINQFRLFMNQVLQHLSKNNSITKKKQIKFRLFFLFLYRNVKAQDLETYAFELLDHPENLAKKDFLLNIVYGKDDDENYFQHQFEIHWPLKENIVAKYEYLENHVLTNLTSYMINKLHYKNVSKAALRVTLAQYNSERAQWIIIERGGVINANKKSTKITNLRLEPYKLSDLDIIGVLEGENLTSNDFDTLYDKKRRKEIEYEKEQKKLNRERNRSENNDRKQTNGSKTRRRSPQNAMRIDVDDFEN